MIAKDYLGNELKVGDFVFYNDVDQVHLVCMVVAIVNGKLILRSNLLYVIDFAAKYEYVKIHPDYLELMTMGKLEEGL